MERLSADQLRAISGVSELPRPLDNRAMMAAVRRHYPAHLRERRLTALVLLEADIDESGRVRDVRVVPPPGGATHRAVILSRDPATGEQTSRPMFDAAFDPAFAPAAEAVLRETTFAPAMLDGTPVPFTLRMSVRFTP
ncbi:MAG TPA: hypothetical protein VFQ39_16585 [Longimicrobium sp.]|nr:hypothetical protein [Longimicrobium sp.]